MAEDVTAADKVSEHAAVDIFSDHILHHNIFDQMPVQGQTQNIAESQDYHAFLYQDQVYNEEVILPLQNN